MLRDLFKVSIMTAEDINVVLVSLLINLNKYAFPEFYGEMHAKHRDKV